MLTKEAICTALYAWINQRPGLDYANYGERTAYRAEVRSITKALHHARQLLRSVELAQSITAQDLIAAFQSACSGRLSISETVDGKVALDYCTGQYWPTEYRSAACAVLSQALWNHRRTCMPSPTLHHNSETGETLERYGGMRAGDWIRASFKREFGRGIAQRWFN